MAKVAVITGGARRIGRAIASHLHIVPTADAIVALPDECCSDEEMGEGLELVG